MFNGSLVRNYGENCWAWQSNQRKKLPQKLKSSGSENGLALAAATVKKGEKGKNSDELGVGTRRENLDFPNSSTSVHQRKVWLLWCFVVVNSSVVVEFRFCWRSWWCKWATTGESHCLMTLLGNAKCFMALVVLQVTLPFFPVNACMFSCWSLSIFAFDQKHLFGALVFSGWYPWWFVDLFASSHSPFFEYGCFAWQEQMPCFIKCPFSFYFSTGLLLQRSRAF